MKRIAISLILLVCLVSCIPQLNTKLQLVVLNGPAEYYVSSLADELVEDLNRYQAGASYQIISRSRAGFAETHNDMSGSRANPSASRIANTFGAEFAVMIGAPIFERTLTKKESSQVVSTQLQVEIRIVDPVTKETLANYSSLRYAKDRAEPLDQPLEDLKDDPDLKSLINSAVSQLSPQVAQDIESLFQRITPILEPVD